MKLPFLPGFYTVKDKTGEISVFAGAQPPALGTKVRVKGRVEAAATVGGQSFGVHIRESSGTIAARRRTRSVAHRSVKDASFRSRELPPTNTLNAPGSASHRPCGGIERQVRRPDREGHLTRLARRQLDALEALQLLHRPRHAADHVAHVELSDLGARAAPGIGERDGHRNWPSRPISDALSFGAE